MARSPHTQSQDLTDRPLADYFWIAGLDGQDLQDAFKHAVANHDNISQLESPLGLGLQEDIIAEDADEDTRLVSSQDTFDNISAASRRNSYQRLSRLSYEAKSSIKSLDKLSHMSSVRSNATIRRVVDRSNQVSPAPGSPRIPSTNGTPIAQDFPKDFRSPQLNGDGTKVLSDVAFEDVMSRFANDRDAFFLDLNFKSEAVQPKASRTLSRPRPRTQKIVPEELETNALPGLPSRAIGSVRRHMSIKDMNSTRRQPSMARRISTRTARRMSSYNSVMPRPQPLAVTPDEHPLRRSFEPALLDRYPRSAQTDELKRREGFPAFVPMFAFPNDIKVIPSDSRPQSTWHELQFTNDDNVKTAAVCVIVYIPLDRQVADDLEKSCEEWRKSHMTEAERDLASSLGERLAAERAKLSQLLTSLPTAESGTTTRENIEDEISKVEDKIALMSDMLKPLRHGAANRIAGLTDGDSGLWIPRAYGIIGPDESMIPFWKEWLKAVVVPMMNGSILRVPPSSPRLGMWQPLEHYVHILCTKALRPLTSKVQVEVGIRELRLYAKKEAHNELPGSRSVDLYPLFRALTIPNIMALFEYVLSESRIILVSAHTAMLKLASKAIMSLIWPLTWQGIHIPVVPSRLIEVVEAPVPYIIGLVRTGDDLPLPEQDDYVVVDLDKNELHATEQPTSLPKQQRRKLMSLLYLAAPLHETRGVPIGVPAYAVHTFPHAMFTSEFPNVFAPIVTLTELAKFATLNSTQFGAQAAAGLARRAPVLNAYQQSGRGSAGSMERPTTSSTARRPSHTGSEAVSPKAYNQFSPTTPQSRNDSGFALQTSLREKRSGNFDSSSRRSPSMSNMRRKASLPFVKHGASPSNISDFQAFNGASNYATSVYAQSTLAASTIMPGMNMQPVRMMEGTAWAEGHCMQQRGPAPQQTCSVCHERMDDGHYRCSDCPLIAHGRCLGEVCIPCQDAFYPDQIRAAFVRFFTSLFYNYRRFMLPADASQRKKGLITKLSTDAWIRSLQPEHAEYLETLKETQAFDQFVLERETKTPTQSSAVALFDALMAAKRGRSKGVRSTIAVSLSGRNPFAGRSPSGGVPVEYISDTSSHSWRVMSTATKTDKPELGPAAKGRDYRAIVSRAPGKLEDDLFPSTPTTHGNDVPPVPALPKKTGLRHRMNGLSMHAP